MKRSRILLYLTYLTHFQLLQQTAQAHRENLEKKTHKSLCALWLNT